MIGALLAANALFAIPIEIDRAFVMSEAANIHLESNLEVWYTAKWQPLALRHLE